MSLLFTSVSSLISRREYPVVSTDCTIQEAFFQIGAKDADCLIVADNLHLTSKISLISIDDFAHLFSLTNSENQIVSDQKLADVLGQSSSTVIYGRQPAIDALRIFCTSFFDHINNKKKHIQFLPVLGENQEFLGILSYLDLISLVMREDINILDEPLCETLPIPRFVARVETTSGQNSIYTAFPETEISQIALFFHLNGSEYMPVVAREGYSVKGLISKRHVYRQFDRYISLVNKTVFDANIIIEEADVRFVLPHWVLRKALPQYLKQPHQGVVTVVKTLKRKEFISLVSYRDIFSVVLEKLTTNLPQ